MNDSNEKERYKHPSFGQISFSRVSGRDHFYGSELEQDHYITMTLLSSEVERTLTKDWYFASGVPLAQVRMSSAQFSELITSLNMGSGACCTIEMIDGKQIAKLPFQESRKEFVHRKFSDRMSEFAKTLKEKQLKAKEIVLKKNISKADVRDLEMHLDFLTQEISNNIPFFMETFQETMDEVVLEAKQEVENAIQHKINILGLAELHQQNKLISNKESIDIENAYNEGFRPAAGNETRNTENWLPGE